MMEEMQKPKRQLSAYNIFFRTERQKILDCTPTRKEGKPRRSHGKIGFADLARTIAAKWKAQGPEERKVFQALAAQDKERYQREMAVWNATRKEDNRRTQEAPDQVGYPITTQMPPFSHAVAAPIKVESDAFSQGIGALVSSPTVPLSHWLREEAMHAIPVSLTRRASFIAPSPLPGLVSAPFGQVKLQQPQQEQGVDHPWSAAPDLIVEPLPQSHQAHEDKCWFPQAAPDNLISNDDLLNPLTGAPSFDDLVETFDSTSLDLLVGLF